MNPCDRPSQVRTQVLVLRTCVDLHRLASPFSQGLTSWRANNHVSFVFVVFFKRKDNFLFSILNVYKEDITAL